MTVQRIGFFFAMVLTACTSFAEPLGDAIASGEFGLDLRYRFEYVDQTGFDAEAKASTLRTRLNYLTKDWQGWRLFVEADNVTELGPDDFNSGAGTSGPDRARFPVVADPDGTEINQAWVNYAFSDNAGIKFGRQRILLDNQRFVGGVGWRQNEQTYDGLSLTATPAGNGKLFLAYIQNVNRIFGDDVAAGDHDQDTLLANMSWPFSEQVKLTAYYYDIDNDDAAAFSTRTAGLRLAGTYPWQERAVTWGLEWADQSDTGNNPVDYSANYWRADAGIGFSTFKLSVGWEVLEGDGTRPGAAFRTPLATLHAFNGWADQFLATPADGLEDRFLGLSGKAGAYQWKLLWHDFSAQSGNRDFGSELDMSLSRKLGQRYGLLLKAALFDASHSAFRDTDKLWLMLTAKY